MANVPLDIWMNICDIVADMKDQKTLMACSLVRPDLTAPCQKHLFSNITVTFGQNPSASNLCQILERNPWLISNIKSLEFKFDTEDQFHFPTVLSLLSKCQNVPSFSIRFQVESNGDLSPMVNILTSPTLTNLCIDGIHIPVAIIAIHIQGNLKHLEVTRGSVLTDPTAPMWKMASSTRSDPISLLSLKANSSTISSLLRAKLADGSTDLFDFTHLQTLTAVEFHNTTAVTALLRRTTRLNTLRMKLRGRTLASERSI